MPDGAMHLISRRCPQSQPLSGNASTWEGQINEPDIAQQATCAPDLTCGARVRPYTSWPASPSPVAPPVHRTHPSQLSRSAGFWIRRCPWQVDGGPRRGDKGILN